MLLWPEGAEPVGNRAERVGCPAVIKRKLRFGMQLSNFRGYIERMLTICASLRRQGQAVTEFIADGIFARRTGQAPTVLARPG